MKFNVAMFRVLRQVRAQRRGARGARAAARRGRPPSPPRGAAPSAAGPLWTRNDTAPPEPPAPRTADIRQPLPPPPLHWRTAFPKYYQSMHENIKTYLVFLKCGDFTEKQFAKRSHHFLKGRLDSYRP